MASSRNVLYERMRVLCLEVLGKAKFETDEDITNCVQELRAALLRDSVLGAPQTQRYLQAIFANVFRTMIRHDKEFDYCYKNLSSDQLRRLKDKLFTPLKTGSVALEDLGMSHHLRYFIVAALYEVHLNMDADYKQIVEMTVEDENKWYMLATNSHGYVTRQSEYANFIAKLEERTHQANVVESLEQRVRAAHAKLTCTSNAQVLPKDKSRREYVKLRLETLATMDNQLAPTRVAIVGELSAGKSTFASELLGCPGLFSSGIGAVTKVFTTVRHVESPFYSAKFFFCTSSDIAQQEQYYTTAINERVEDKDERDYDMDDQYFDIVDMRLRQLYATMEHPGLRTLVVNLSEKREKENDKKCWAMIDAPMKEIVCEDLATLAEQIDYYLKANQSTYSCVLKDVVLEGPFEHLPAGVELVDTPGLGDSAKGNSARTHTHLDDFDVIWYVAESSKALQGVDQNDFLSMMFKIKKNVSIVATKADSPNDRKEDAKNMLVRSLLEIKYLIKLKEERPEFRFDRSSVWEIVKQKSDEWRREVEDEINDITLGFIGRQSVVSGARGFEYVGLDQWREELNRLTGEWEGKYEEQRRLAAALLTQLNPSAQSNPVGGRGAMRQGTNEIGDAKKMLNGATTSVFRPDSNFAQRLSDVLAGWRLKWNTVRALMNSTNKGVFHTTRKPRGYFNINLALACQIVDALQEEWENFIRSMKNYLHRSDDPVANNCWLEILALSNEFFIPTSLEKTIQAHWGFTVYGIPKRNKLPTLNEIKQLLTFIREECIETIELMHIRFEAFIGDSINTHIPAVQSDPAIVAAMNLLNPSTRLSLQSVLPPIRFLCHIDHSILRVPVSGTCCKHIFDRSNLSEGQQECPACGSSPLELRNHFSLQDNVSLWAQQNEGRRPHIVVDRNVSFGPLNVPDETDSSPAESPCTPLTSRSRKRSLKDKDSSSKSPKKK